MPEMNGIEVIQEINTFLNLMMVKNEKSRSGPKSLK